MKFTNKKVLITGASSGIGLATAHAFAEVGSDLILCARRHDRLLKIKQELESEHGISVTVMVADVSDGEALDRAFSALPPELKAVDVLVNNAGLALALDPIDKGSRDDWNRMIDTNVKGLLYMTQLVMREMLKVNKGHIINIGSMSGYSVYSGGVVYCATKHAVRALSEGIKMDVHGTPIRVTEIDPGMAETEFSNVRFKGDDQRAKDVYHDTTPLTAADIADAILYCATRPAHVDIRSLLIMPTDQTAAHMLHREEKE